MEYKAIMFEKQLNETVEKSKKQSGEIVGFMYESIPQKKIKHNTFSEKHKAAIELVKWKKELEKNRCFFPFFGLSIPTDLEMIKELMQKNEIEIPPYNFVIKETK